MCICASSSTCSSWSTSPAFLYTVTAVSVWQRTPFLLLQLAQFCQVYHIQNSVHPRTINVSIRKESTDRGKKRTKGTEKEKAERERESQRQRQTKTERQTDRLENSRNLSAVVFILPHCLLSICLFCLSLLFRLCLSLSLCPFLSLCFFLYFHTVFALFGWSSICDKMHYNSNAFALVMIRIKPNLT